MFKVGFPTEQDNATFTDKGTEVPLLSQDKRTMRQAQNLATGPDGLGQPVEIWDGIKNRTITIFLSKSEKDAGRDNHYFFSMISCFKTSVFECPFLF